MIHLKIQNSGSRYSLGQGTNESFGSIPELVKYHRTNEIKVSAGRRRRPCDQGEGATTVQGAATVQDAATAQRATTAQGAATAHAGRDGCNGHNQPTPFLSLARLPSASTSA